MFGIKRLREQVEYLTRMIEARYEPGYYIVGVRTDSGATYAINTDSVAYAAMSKWDNKYQVLVVFCGPESDLIIHFDRQADAEQVITAVCRVKR